VCGGGGCMLCSSFGPKELFEQSAHRKSVRALDLQFRQFQFAITRQKSVRIFEFCQEWLVVHSRTEQWTSVSCDFLTL
jgi:hypothetical protein